MTYFTWKEEGLTNDCETLDSMAARFEESARLMRKMSAEGFKVEKRNKRQIITHTDSKILMIGASLVKSHHINNLN